MHETVIVNTSPLFYLHRLGCIHILEKLYGDILIPEAVVNELKEGKTVGEDVPEIEDYRWITVKNVVVPAFIKIIPDLGNGEAEVLALGCQENNPLLVIDDSLARRIAKLQEFKLTGTAGVLVKAKKAGHLTQIKPLMDKLKEVGFYLKDELILEILKNAGE
jgi:predicted nucleic acid-binding protein